MKTIITLTGPLPKAFKITRATLKAAALSFAARSSARIGVPFREVTVILQDDGASDAVHRAIMGVEGATDVITQGYEAIPPEPAGVYGELYVNACRALDYAAAHGTCADDELLLYVAHGMDHLSGADDHETSERQAMRRRERAWIRAFWKGRQDV